MATVTATWNTGSGNWFSAANWDEPNPNPPPPVLHDVPGIDNDVVIPDQSRIGTPFTVTYNGTSTVNTLTGAANLTLNILGGSLTSVNGGNPVGTVNVSAGARFVSGQGVQSFNGGSIAGTLAGDGTFRFVNGTFDIEAGASITVGTWLLTYQIGSGTVSTTNLKADLTYANTFQLLDVSGNFPILRLNNHVLTLTGQATLDGRIQGPGTIKLRGTGEIVGSGLEDGARLQVFGAVTQSGGFAVDGVVRVEAGATYAITTASTITGRGTNGLTMVNAGSLGVTGAGTSTISGLFSNTGTLSVGAGAVLNLDAGTQTLGGTVTGAGTLNLGFAHDTTLNTTALTVGTLRVAGGNGGGTVRLAKDIAYGGRFVLDDTGVFDLNGRTLTLSGQANLVGGTIDGTGRLTLTGTATFGAVNFGYNGSPVTIENAGSVTQTGRVSLNGTLLNDAGRSYTIATASNITRTDAGASVVNNGNFVVTGTGTSTVSGNFTNAGTLAIGRYAVLNLDAGTQILNGSVSGKGTLNLGFAHDTTLNTTSLTVAAIAINGGNGGGTVRLAKDLTYAGRFTFNDPFGTLDLNGRTLTLSGTAALTGGIVDGPGRLTIAGTATVAAIGFGYHGSSVTVENAGGITQTGNVSLNGTLLNNAGHSYTIAAASNITRTDAGASIVNNGNFVVTGTGTSTVSGNFTNAGTLAIAKGAVLNLDAGTQILNGSVSGKGVLNLGFAHDTSLNTSSLTVASIAINGGNGGGTVRLAKDLTYAGRFTFNDPFGTFDLNGRTLTLTGATTLTGGVLDGPGTLLIDGATTLGFFSVGYGGSAATLRNGGTATQTGYLTLNGILRNDADATYTITQASDITVSGAGGTVVNDGLFRDAAAGTSRIDAAFTNNGLVKVEAGTLVLTSLTNVGIIQGVITEDNGRTIVTPDAAGQVTQTGGTGNNQLDGGAGADILRGGTGNDTYLVNSKSDAVFEAAGQGSDTLVASASYQLAAGQAVETLQFAASTGQSALNLIGNEFGQSLTGNAGANLLNGGLGNDVLRGNAGADSFAFATAIGPSNVDRIVDFAPGQDQIQLSKSQFKALPLGGLSANAFKDLAIDGAQLDADDRILYDHETGVLRYDADGSGSAAAVTFAILDNHALLTHAGILVV